MGDYEIDDEGVCTNCGHSPIHSRNCQEINCNDGWVDDYDDDPLWYDPGDGHACGECNGTGYEVWCPSCGENLSGQKTHSDQDDD